MICAFSLRNLHEICPKFDSHNRDHFCRDSIAKTDLQLGTSETCRWHLFYSILCDSSYLYVRQESIILNLRMEAAETREKKEVTNSNKQKCYSNDAFYELKLMNRKMIAFLYFYWIKHSCKRKSAALILICDKIPGGLGKSKETLQQ